MRKVLTFFTNLFTRWENRATYTGGWNDPQPRHVEPLTPAILLEELPSRPVLRRARRSPVTTLRADPDKVTVEPLDLEPIPHVFSQPD